MQDDFKVPTPASGDVPPEQDKPLQLNEPTQLPPEPTPPSGLSNGPVVIQPSMSPDEPTSSGSFSALNSASEPVAAPDTALPKLSEEPVQPTPPKPLVPDFGPIPPATSMDIPSGQAHGPVYAGSNMGVMSSTQKPKKKSLPFLWVGLAVVFVLLLVAGYVFGIYLPSTPSHVYSASLTNSGLALDKLIQYSEQQQHTQYTSANFTGSLHYKSPTGSYDATLNGAAGKNGDLTAQFALDAMGLKVNANLLSVKAAGNTSPDVYFQITGVKSLLDSIGMNKYDYLDGQWIVVDHTFLDTYSSMLSKDLNNASNVTKSKDMPTAAQVDDAINRVQAVNKAYLFTTDPNKAVLANQQFIAKETSGGRALDHYKVGYNKAHLSAYVAAVGQALDASQFNSWFKTIESGKNLSDEMDLTSLQSNIDKGSGTYTFDLWADVKTKLVAKVSFTDPSDKSTVFSIGQNYIGGTTYPITFGFTGKDTSGNSSAGNFSLTFDTQTEKSTASFTVNTTSSSGISNITGNASFTPSNNTVKVTAPANAKSLTDILVALGLNGLANGTSLSSGGASTALANPFAVTQ